MCLYRATKSYRMNIWKKLALPCPNTLHLPLFWQYEPQPEECFLWHATWKQSDERLNRIKPRHPRYRTLKREGHGKRRPLLCPLLSEPLTFKHHWHHIGFHLYQHDRRVPTEHPFSFFSPERYITCFLFVHPPILFLSGAESDRCFHTS